MSHNKDDLQIEMIKIKEEFFQSRVTEQSKIQEHLKNFQQAEEQIRTFYEGQLERKQSQVDSYVKSIQVSECKQQELEKSFYALSAKHEALLSELDLQKKRNISLCADVHHLTSSNVQYNQKEAELRNLVNTQERTLLSYQNKIKELESNVQEYSVMQQQLEEKLQKALASSTPHTNEIQKEKLSYYEKLTTELISQVELMKKEKVEQDTLVREIRASSVEQTQTLNEMNQTLTVTRELAEKFRRESLCRYITVDHNSCSYLQRKSINFHEIRRM
eukprot:TRINITY_DN9246_c0_g1_i9.p1 TRINITY_DN9246_c0_g1~~TRINITY_DN9246_c0_g1_i9.p1  ORF type:complete len:275 (-),score=57.34 TRINITY_DN9246_c0_g1_i9:1630-2454(-)